MKKLLLLITLFTLFTHHSFTQWVQQTVPVTMPIIGIKFIDTSKGWACTGTFNVLDTGFIMNTTNGGTNWNIQLRYPAMKFTDIEFINQNTGYIAGNQNDSARTKLFTTTNGGLNWSYISMVTNMYIDDMQFLNKDSAWECGSSAGPDVRTTTDGGNTWVVRTNGILSATQRIFFLNYNTGFCGANNNVLYKTTNAGLNWISLSAFPELVFSVFFINNSIGFTGLAGGKVGSTTNGGLNWFIQQPFAINSNNTTDIYFIDNNTGWAGTGWFQKILKTTNGGINWGYQLVPTGSVKISIADNMHGWAADIGISNTNNSGGPITYVGINIINSQIPNLFKLYQNYPNPFNPVTTIKIDVHSASHIKLIIFDILGRELYKEEEYLRTGSYEFKWDASEYSSGTYFYRFITNEYTETKKMILIK
jgi:photosystem II stability/assembly factor-like uncharacterized protein